MKAAYKVFLLVGAIFMFVGLLVTTVFFANRDVFGLFSLFPLLFFFIGVGLLIFPIRNLSRNRKIIKNGTRDDPADRISARE